MKKNILNIIKIIVLVVIVLAVVIVAVNAFSNNDDNSEVKDKASQDLLYLENKLISIANKLNNISFGHYVISESKIEDNLVGNNESNSNGKEQGNSSQEQNSGNKDESSQQENSGVNEESSSSGGQNNTSSFEKEDKIKYELKQDSVLNRENKQIDWDFIKTNIELLYSNWAQTVIDLHSLNVDNQDILSFGRELDNLIVAAKNEDKKETLRIVSNLYSYIPKYEQQFSDDTKSINIQYTKYYVLNSYYLVEDLKWNDMKNSLDSAENYFSNVINSINGDGSDKDKISKIYVLLNELDASLNLQDTDVFYIKYKALMEDLGNL